ncbi:MAG: response regulator [Chloroflexota bacterium]|nr:MAG: response regulator [Chloroflexota bacterium]
MADNIRILIVDDIPETRENVRKLLQFESDLEVIGHAASGGEAISMAEDQRPDIILMDINMPDADGISASQTITERVPGAQVIIMSVQSEADYLRRAMLAGARDFLMKPFSGDELVEAVRNVHRTRPVASAPLVPLDAAARPGMPGEVARPARMGKVLAVFSPKGGIGCTTVAVNTAVAVAQAGNNTLLIDASLQFGDVGVMLNMKSSASIVDLVERVGDLDQDLVSSVLMTHESGLRVLLSPPRPEMAELVTADAVRTLMITLRTLFDFIVVDTSTSLDDVSLGLLELADRIILVTHQSLPSLKNVSRFFDLSEVLEYEREKVVLVINHASKRKNITVKDIEDTLKWPAVAVIPEDSAAYDAADQGRPLVSATWQKRAASQALVRFARRLAEELGRELKAGAGEESNGTSRLARLFNK